MNPGELRNKIDIQNYAEVENEAGEKTKQWQSYVKVWAKFLNNKIKGQVLKAEKETSLIFYEIVIWYRTDIDTAMRVVYQGKSYNIDHVINWKELNVETHLFCTLIEEGPYNE